MVFHLKSRLKVSSVSSVAGPDGKESVRVTFVEEHVRPPPIAMMPQDAPKEISSVVFQVQKGIQQVLPRDMARLQKIVLVFTAEELEAFEMKPYPNQIYEVTITGGNLRFESLSG